MLYRDFNHFAGDFAPAPKIRYGISVSTIADVKNGRTWVAVALTHRSCKGPAHAPLIMQVVLAIPNVAINGDDLSDPGFRPRLIDGAATHGSPTVWNWYQDRTQDLKGFNLNLKADDAKGGIASCEVPTGQVDYYQTCCGGWAVFEFNVKGVWNVSDIGWGTIFLTNPTGPQTTCNFIGDGSRSAGSTQPGPVCTPE